MAKRVASPSSSTRTVDVREWTSGIRLSAFSVIMLSLVVLGAWVLVPTLGTYIEQRQQIAALQAEVDAAQDSVDELTDDVARWSDPAYIESQARERLYYIVPGDISYLVVDDGDHATTSDGQPISTSIQTTQVDWLASLLDSVYTAGLTEAPPEELGATP